MMSNPNKVVGDYAIRSKIIGRGNFSTIYEGYHQQFNKQVAVKKLDVEDTQKLKTYVQREIDLHQQLSHPNIITMYDYILDVDDKCMYIFMEYCPNGDFTKFQKKRPMMEAYIQKYMYQFITGLQYLYDSNIFHRDLKPHNLLLDHDFTLKISDFGLSKYDNSNGNGISLHNTFCGSPLYMAPEVLFNSQYDNKSDLWSIGVILYEWITGEHPYYCKNLTELTNMMKTSDFHLSEKWSSTISKPLVVLLEHLMNKNPENRINWPDLFTNKWINTNLILKYENSLMEFNPSFGQFPTLDRTNKHNFIFVEDYERHLAEQETFLQSSLIKRELEPLRIQKPRILNTVSTEKTTIVEQSVDEYNEFDGLFETAVDINPSNSNSNINESDDDDQQIIYSLKEAMMTVEKPIDIKMSTSERNRRQFNFKLESPNFKAKSIHEVKKANANARYPLSLSSNSSNSTPESITNSVKNLVLQLWNGIK
jgi:aurora kinase